MGVEADWKAVDGAFVQAAAILPRGYSICLVFLKLFERSHTRRPRRLGHPRWAGRTTKSTPPGFAA
jgi:hypothetical protein